MCNRRTRRDHLTVPSLDGSITTVRDALLVLQRNVLLVWFHPIHIVTFFGIRLSLMNVKVFCVGYTKQKQ